MKRALKWTAIVLVSIVAALLVCVFGVSEYRLRGVPWAVARGKGLLR